MTKDESLRLALEALENLAHYADTCELFLKETHPGKADALRQRVTKSIEAITAIKAALEAKDEPVAWMDASRFEELRNGFTVMTTLTKKKAFFDDIAIYTTPPQRKPLTDEEIKKCWDSAGYTGTIPKGFARAIEAAHGIAGEKPNAP
jgi:hypothetical protein